MDLGFDDGTVVAYGDDGTPLTITGPNGAAQPVSDSPIVEQFRSLFNYGVRGFIDRALAPSPVQSQQATAPNAPGTAGGNAVGAWRQYVPLLMLAAGVAIVWRVLKSA